MSDEIPGLQGDPLPDGWKLVKFREVVSITSGQVDPRQTPYSSMIHIGPEDIEEGTGRILRPRTAAELGLISGKYHFRPGDVVYSKIRPYLRKVALPSFEGVCSADMYPLHPSDGTLESPFLYLWMLSGQFTRQAESHQSRTGIPKINRTQLDSTWMPSPPIKEQRAIADVLLSIQEAREATEKVIAATRQLKQSLMRHLFTYGSVPIDQADKVTLAETDLGPVPEHWENVSLGDIAVLTSGGTPSKSRPDYWEGTIPWASPKDMKRLRLTDTEDHISREGMEAGSRLAPAGSIFVVVRGMILSRDLPVAMAMVPMAFNQDMKAILPNSRVDADFLLYALIRHKGQLLPEIGTSAHGTRRIGTSSITDLRIPLPPISEQQAIAAQLEAMESKLTTEESRVAALEILFRTLLSNLMTGKLRMSEPAFQIASGLAS